MPAQIEVLPPNYHYSHQYTPVWKLDLTDDLRNDPAARDAVNAFLDAHGVDNKRVPVPSVLLVCSERDGLVLYVERFAKNADGEFERCPCCPGCMKQELVRAPLAATVGQLPTGWVNPPFAEAFRGALFGTENAAG